MKRRRHEDRVAGVNARFRPAPGPLKAEGVVITGGLEHAPRIPVEQMRDRLRYGDCAGFGAPAARAFHERTWD